MESEKSDFSPKGTVGFPSWKVFEFERLIGNMSNQSFRFAEMDTGALLLQSETSVFHALEIYERILGSVFLLCAILTVIPIIISIPNRHEKPPGFYPAQIGYILALLAKGICLIIDPSLNQQSSINNLGTRGTPGYFSAAAYCLILISWCEVCILAASETSKYIFYRTKTILKWLLLIVGLLFIIFWSLFFVQKKSVFHYLESSLAILRDSSIALAFVFYVLKIRELFEHNCCDWINPESRLFNICVVIIFALFYRTMTILCYMFIWQKNQESVEYGIVFMIDQILCEFIPLMIISLVRCCPSNEPAYMNDTPIPLIQHSENTFTQDI